MTLADTLNGVWESAIAGVSPLRALQRKVARREMEALSRGAYRGARNDRIRGRMRGIAGDADDDSLDDLPTLRVRSRDLVRNNSLAAGMLQTLVDNVAGPSGYSVRPAVVADDVPGLRQTQAEAWNLAAKRAWERFIPHADASERTDWGGLLRLMCRSQLESGDAFPHLLFVERPQSRYGLCIELLEADYVDTPPGLMTDPMVRGGVKIGTRNQPIGFWVHKHHPGSGAGMGRHIGNLDYRFIRRWNSELGRPNMLQHVAVERPGQNRGVPVFAPVIGDLDDLGSLVESEVVATRFAACIAGIVKRNSPMTAAMSRAAATNEAGERLESLQPGIIEYLDPDEDFQLVNPQRPGSTFDQFLTRLIRNIARGIGLPYELGALDFQKTNFSSTKASFLEARRMFRCRQMDLVRISQLVYELVLEEAWLRGDLPDLDFGAMREDLVRARWQLPGWGWIDPVKEIQASALAIEKRLSTLAAETEAYQGEDWLDNQRQRAIETRTIRELEEEQGNPTGPAAADANPQDGGDAGDDESTPENRSEAEEEEMALAGAGAVS